MTRFLPLLFVLLLPLSALRAQAPQESAPRIISSPPLEAVAGQSYTYTISATGDPTPTFRLAKGPGSMILDAGRGRLIWTPTRANAGPVEVTVEALNSAGTDSQSFTITVMTLPQFGVVPPQSTPANREYRYSVPVDASPAPDFSLVQWPEGMSIGATSGELVWTPTSAQIGSHSVSVQARNKAGSKLHTFLVEVTSSTAADLLASPSSLALLSISPLPLERHQPLTLHLRAPRAMGVRLVLTDLLGRESQVRSLDLREGTQSVVLRFEGLSSGLWFLRLSSVEGETRSLLRVR